MTNWLADPVACAVRLRDQRGCEILSARSEVLSRSTRCIRTVEHDGTYWRWGHLYARRELDAKKREVIVGGSHGQNPAHVTETALMSPEHANVMSDLLRAAFANNGSSQCGGETILELMWRELMAIYDRLMSAPSADGRDPGRAEGLAYAIAIMQNPYLPNVDAVREQAADRWEQEAE